MMMFSLIVVATDAATDDATNDATPTDGATADAVTDAVTDAATDAATDATPTDGAEKKDWRVSNRFVSPRYSRQLRG